MAQDFSDFIAKVDAATAKLKRQAEELAANAASVGDISTLQAELAAANDAKAAVQADLDAANQIIAEGSAKLAAAIADQAPAAGADPAAA